MKSIERMERLGRPSTRMDVDEEVDGEDEGGNGGDRFKGYGGRGG